jgi:hypothetical protein
MFLRPPDVIIYNLFHNARHVTFAVYKMSLKNGRPTESEMKGGGWKLLVADYKLDSRNSEEGLSTTTQDSW